MVVFEDSFNGSTIDLSSWDVRGTAANQSGGKVNLLESGIIIRGSFAAPYTLTGSYLQPSNSINSYYSSFDIFFRTSGNNDGIRVSLGVNSYSIARPVWDNFSAYTILKSSSNSSLFQPITPDFTAAPDTEHFFTIRDSGDIVSIDIDGINIFEGGVSIEPPLGIPTPTSWGDTIAFYAPALWVGDNFLFTTVPTGGVDLMGVQVIIPEPSSLSLLLIGVAGVASRRLLKRKG